MLFKPEHVEPILRGEKTQTRRNWKKRRAKEGAIHKAKLVTLSRDYFALIKIMRVRQERLGDISEADARAEGGYTIESYRQEWIRINGSWDPDQIVYVVSFGLEDKEASARAKGEIMEELECGGCGKHVGCREKKFDVVVMSETGLCLECLDSGKYTSMVNDCKCLEANGGRCGGCYAWRELGDKRPSCYEQQGHGSVAGVV